MPSVLFRVWSDLCVNIGREEGESDSEFLDRAKEKAEKEQPQVYWMFDEDEDPLVSESECH